MDSGSREGKRIDVIHTHMSAANYFGVLVSWLSGAPCVATAHAYNRQWQVPNGLAMTKLLCGAPTSPRRPPTVRSLFSEVKSFGSRAVTSIPTLPAISAHTSTAWRCLLGRTAA